MLVDLAGMANRRESGFTLAPTETHDLSQLLDLIEQRMANWLPVMSGESYGGASLKL